MIEQQLGFDIESFLRGILGIAVVLGGAYLMSFDRKRIDWKLVGSGLFMQLVFAFAILYVPVVGLVLEWIGKAFIKLMDFTQSGVAFLLGPLVTKSEGFIFLLNSLPVVIFFSALVSLFYYWGIIQRVVEAFSWILRRFMSISGAEGLVASGNVFLGMTESPVLIKNYLPVMNRSEIFLVMVSGMGTIAGTVMGTYISMLAGGDPVSRVLFAKHLLSASLMAAPGSIVLAKMICPADDSLESGTSRMERENLNVSSQYLLSSDKSVLGALSSGTSTGVRLMVNIAAMLLVFIAMVALANYMLEGVIGRYTGLNDWIVSVTDGKAHGLTFQFILGVVLSPLMWLIGVPYQDVMLVGSLLGQKTILNEFIAYFQLQEWKDAGLFLYQKSVIMSTYILCGFANISSIGILLGGMGVLAPEKRDLITRFGFPAMIGGALVSILSATIIGMVLVVN
ncbi:MAG: Na+ dependent nucleoside transporter [Parabacteroides sp.]|nr:Na+ dependent nucleoside transporter [Parabacteroides sp.]